MRLVFLLCAAFALCVAAAVPVEVMDAPQNMQPEEKPDESLSLMTGTSEKQETVPVVKEEVRIQAKAGCKPGWAKYGSRCFIFIDRKMPWIQAEKFCVEKGTNLASVHNPGEYDFIQEIMRGATGYYPQAWIGGTDAVRDRTWFWSDGSWLHFQLWSSGEPNNAGGNEKCLEINSSASLRWNDFSCAAELPFVCGTRPV